MTSYVRYLNVQRMFNSDVLKKLLNRSGFGHEFGSDRQGQISRGPLPRLPADLIKVFAMFHLYFILPLRPVYYHFLFEYKPPSKKKFLVFWHIQNLMSNKK
jgi:hypothetical protein